MMAKQDARGRTGLAVVVSVVFLAFVFLACLHIGMMKPVNHDEHQFVAPAKLLGSKGLLPYRGFPYLHTPNMVLVCAPALAGTDRVLFTARLCSIACAFLMLVLVYVVAFRAFGGRSSIARVLIAAGAVLLLLCNPLFNRTSGLAWNHDLAVLLAVAACVVYCKAARSKQQARWLFVSGLCLGAAITTRISFAPLVVPFLAMLVWFPEPKGLRARFVSLFVPPVAGMVVAAVPTLVLFALAPGRFWYENVTYHMLEVPWRLEHGLLARLTLYERALYAKELLGAPGNLLVAGAFVVLAWLPRVFRDRASLREHFDAAFVWALVPFLVAGALGPSPMFRQYLYALMPFLVLGIVYGLAQVPVDRRERTWALRLFGALVVACCIYWPPQVRISPSVFRPNAWAPMGAHHKGREIRGHVEAGKVLTLAPIYPLEAGLDIYAEFATGPFIWRSSHFVPKDRRKALGIVAPDDLEAFLENDPPAAILTGYENRFDLERPLIGYATAHEYRAIELPSGGTLWLAPTER